MNNATVFKLKQHVTEDDLVGVGYKLLGIGAIKELECGASIYIPLKKATKFGYRVIQYNEPCTYPEDLNPEYIEDLVARGWVEKKGKKKMKRQHTEKYILKIAAELNMTPYEVKSQVNEYLGDNLLYYQAINYLRDLKADDIRFILRFNKW